MVWSVPSSSPPGARARGKGWTCQPADPLCVCAASLPVWRGCRARTRPTSPSPTAARTARASQRRRWWRHSKQQDRGSGGSTVDDARAGPCGKEGRAVPLTVTQNRYTCVSQGQEPVWDGIRFLWWVGRIEVFVACVSTPPSHPAPCHAARLLPR